MNNRTDLLARGALRVFPVCVFSSAAFAFVALPALPAEARGRVGVPA